MRKSYSVYKTGPGSGSPLFTGSKTDCLRFAAYVLNEYDAIEIVKN